MPLLLILLAATSADEGVTNAAAAVRLLFEQIGYGCSGGWSRPRWARWSSPGPADAASCPPEWRRVATLATAAACYGLAVPLGGSGFIAAFTGGLVFGWLSHQEVPALTELVVDGGELFAALTFVLFGAVVVGQLLHRVDAAVVIYAALSLTAVRMLPVAVALLGSHARLPTVGFIGWFGPRGLASIVFVGDRSGGAGAVGGVADHVIASVTVLASVYPPRPDGRRRSQPGTPNGMKPTTGSRSLWKAPTHTAIIPGGSATAPVSSNEP